MSRFRFLFAWLVLAAIPLQGYAAASMLFCGMGAGHHAPVRVQAPEEERHDNAKHGHGEAMVKAQADPQADGQSQLPDASHKCGACAACSHSVAITQTPRALALAAPPQAEAAEPFVPVDPWPAPVPDKPPRI